MIAAEVFAVLNAALAAHASLAVFAARAERQVQIAEPLLVLWGDKIDAVESAVAAWACARGGELVEHVARYDKAPYFANEQIRTVQVIVGGNTIAKIQYPAEPIVDVAKVEIATGDGWSPAHQERQ